MPYSAVTAYARPLLAPLCLGDPARLAPTGSLPGAQLRQQATTSASWTATTHTFVGAGNRVTPSCCPASNFDKDPALIEDDAKHNVHYQAESAKQHALDTPQGQFRLFSEQSNTSQIPPPRLAAKRYIPKNASGSITLLMLTGMGLPKEMFEPMIEQIIQDVEVAEIWSVDMPLSGESALVNSAGYLYGNEKDISRDLMLFIISYLPLMPGQQLPAELQPRTTTSNNTSPTRADLHVIAHSLGAQSSLLISAHAPDLFASITVFDPAFIPDGKIRKAFTAMPKDILCTGIKYEYKDKAALAAEIDSNRRTKGWDSRVKSIFVERGAAQHADGKVRLTAHPRLEWALYYDQETPTHCYDRLTDIRVPLNAIMPARPFAVPPAMLEADLAKLKQKTRLTWIPKSTHQLPFERVDECSRLVVAWLKDYQPSSKL